VLHELAKESPYTAFISRDLLDCDDEVDRISMYATRAERQNLAAESGSSMGRAILTRVFKIQANRTSDTLLDFCRTTRH
jgi:hypothetical protein